MSPRMSSIIFGSKHMAAFKCLAMVDSMPSCQTMSNRWMLYLAGARRWHTLMRSRATDDVSGRIRLGFAWDMSARSLLRLKLATLERVYAQRLEILCMLRPVSPQAALRWTAVQPVADFRRRQADQVT